MAKGLGDRYGIESLYETSALSGEFIHAAIAEAIVRSEEVQLLS